MDFLIEPFDQDIVNGLYHTHLKCQDEDKQSLLDSQILESDALFNQSNLNHAKEMHDKQHKEIRQLDAISSKNSKDRLNELTEHGKYFYSYIYRPKGHSWIRCC
jgi:hypothetical protein